MTLYLGGENMSDTILTTIKKMIGIDGITSYDVEILASINMVGLTLNQLGIGPDDGLIIDTTTMWSSIISTNKLLESIKMLIFLKVKLLFDPPQSNYVIESINEQIKNLEWRLNNYEREVEV
jgi:hypothetical protein